MVDKKRKSLKLTNLKNTALSMAKGLSKHGKVKKVMLETSQTPRLGQHSKSVETKIKFEVTLEN